MSRALPWLSLAFVLVLGACVTINVYFPAAAAEKAADRIIDEVWGKDAGAAPDRTSGARPLHHYVLTGEATRMLRVSAASFGQWFVRSAAAQANLDISTPAINALQASMKARHGQLEPFYAAGAVGLTDEGLIAVRDAKALSLADRPRANRLVAEENQDRNALYRAIATANGHPEWEPQIRTTFARRWIDKAAAGWYYESGGSWQQR